MVSEELGFYRLLFVFSERISEWIQVRMLRSLITCSSC